MTKSNRRKSCFVLIITITSLIYYFSHAYNFLSPTYTVKPDILIVEGWLPEEVLNEAKSEFLGKGYKLLIITGFPYNKGYLMGSYGKMVFNIYNKINNRPDSLYSILLKIRGTKAKGKYAHFGIYTDSLEIGDSYTTWRKKTYSFSIKRPQVPGRIEIEFDNDAYTRNRDRNLYVYSVMVNGRSFPANSKYVSLYGRKNGKYYLKRQLSNSTASDAANYLTDIGIPDSLLVPVETSNKIKSKTYTSAIDVKQWLDENMTIDHPSLTIFTQGPHARRSYISFKKAFGNSTDIGVIACRDKEITRSTWWKTRKGWRKIIYETVGVIYAGVFL